MKRICLALLISFFLLSIAVFAQSEKTDTEAIKKSADPIVENILNALKAKDFKRATKDFSDVMLKALPPEKLETTYKDDIEPMFGTYISKTFDHVDVKEGFIAVHYTAKFTKEENALVVATFKEGDSKYLVQGFWIKPFPSTKRASKEESEAIRKAVEPVVNNYFDALKAKDYMRMTKDFSPKMIEALKPEQLKAGYEKEIASKFGTFQSAAFDRVDIDKNFSSVYYIANYSKGTQMQVKFVFKTGDPEHKLYGLWEHPL